MNEIPLTLEELVIPLTVEELVLNWEAKQELKLFICVTPMEAPTGIIHYLDYVYNGPND
jgi:hypothetical protein